LLTVASAIVKNTTQNVLLKTSSRVWMG